MRLDKALCKSADAIKFNDLHSPISSFKSLAEANFVSRQKELKACLDWLDKTIALSALRRPTVRVYRSSRPCVFLLDVIMMF